MTRSLRACLIASLLAVPALPWLAGWRAHAKLHQEIQVLQRRMEELPR